MARENHVLLDTNDLFPEMTWQLASGETHHLPQEMGEGFKIILIYRGGW